MQILQDFIESIPTNAFAEQRRNITTRVPAHTAMRKLAVTRQENTSKYCLQFVVCRHVQSYVMLIGIQTGLGSDVADYLVIEKQLKKLTWRHEVSQIKKLPPGV